MELTNEEIAKVFLMYGDSATWVAKRNNALWDDDEGQSKTYITKNKSNSVATLLEYMGYRLYDHIYEFFLGLTPLSKISDEDAIEVAKIELRGEDLEYISPIQWGKESVQIRQRLRHLYWDTYQYLISKSYDVPLFFAPNHWANGKTAIELGIAIDRTL